MTIPLIEIVMWDYIYFEYRSLTLTSRYLGNTISDCNEINDIRYPVIGIH